MIEQTQDRFNFFLPATFEKGKDPKTQEDTVFVKGIITDPSKDSDGDELMPENLDFTDFSYINWDHGHNPEDFIGCPTNVKVNKGQNVEMTGQLWTDTKKGQEAAKLMEALAKRNKQLGWSIEGQVTERHLVTKRPVKAKVTAVALCPFPKNGNTYATLAKSESIDSAYQDPKVLEFTAENNGGDSETLLVHFLDEFGNEIQIMKDFSIRIKKAISTQDNSGGSLKVDSLYPSDIKMKKNLISIKKAFDDNLITEDDLYKCYSIAMNYFEKGGRAMVGEIRTFGGRQYVRTVFGWKFYGKGTGRMGSQHANNSSHYASGYKAAKEEEGAKQRQAVETKEQRRNALQARVEIQNERKEEKNEGEKKKPGVRFASVQSKINKHRVMLEGVSNSLKSEKQKLKTAKTAEEKNQAANRIQKLQAKETAIKNKIAKRKASGL